MIYAEYFSVFNIYKLCEGVQYLKLHTYAKGVELVLVTSYRRKHIECIDAQNAQTHRMHRRSDVELVQLFVTSYRRKHIECIDAQNSQTHRMHRRSDAQNAQTHRMHRRIKHIDAQNAQTYRMHRRIECMTHRMHQVDLFSIFLCDTCIAEKSQQFFKIRDDNLYIIVKGFDKYV